MEVGQQVYLKQDTDIGKKGTRLEVVEVITGGEGERLCRVAGITPDGTPMQNHLTLQDQWIVFNCNPEHRHGAPLTDRRLRQIKEQGVGTEKEPLVRVRGVTAFEAAQVMQEAYSPTAQQPVETPLKGRVFVVTAPVILGWDRGLMHVSAGSHVRVSGGTAQPGVVLVEVEIAGSEGERTTAKIPESRLLNGGSFAPHHPESPSDEQEG